MQPIITTSSTEAEYVALMDAVKEALWFKRLARELGFPQKPIRIYVDNKGAIDIACNQRTSMRTKHIDLKYHWVREQVEAGHVQLIHVAGTENISDILIGSCTTTRNSNDRFHFKKFFIHTSYPLVFRILGPGIEKQNVRRGLDLIILKQYARVHDKTAIKTQTSYCGRSRMFDT